MSKLQREICVMKIHLGLSFGSFLWAISFLLLIALDFMGEINLKEFSFKEIILSGYSFLPILCFLLGTIYFIYSLICWLIIISRRE